MTLKGIGASRGIAIAKVFELKHYEIKIEKKGEVQQWKSVLEAIKHLPDQQKQVLYLYYIKELSHKEIGEILGINPQSSMNTLAKSIKKLRAALGGHSDSLLLFFIVKSLLWLH